MTEYLVHIGYSLMFWALLVRDIVWLRGLLIAAQASLALYAMMLGLFGISLWNWIFVLVNAAWIMRIRREREQATIPPLLQPLYERHFSVLLPHEFLRFWQRGRQRSGSDIQWIKRGEQPDALHFLLDGCATVSRDNEAVAVLQPGSFIGEMSLLSGEPTTADVKADGEVEYMSWSARQLKRIRRRDPKLWTKIQSVIGLDLVRKISHGTVADTD